MSRAWVVYTYGDDGLLHAVELWATAEEAARSATLYDRARIAPWDFGTRLTQAVREWENER